MFVKRERKDFECLSLQVVTSEFQSDKLISGQGEWECYPHNCNCENPLQWYSLHSSVGSLSVNDAVMKIHAVGESDTWRTRHRHQARRCCASHWTALAFKRVGRTIAPAGGYRTAAPQKWRLRFTHSAGMKSQVCVKFTYVHQVLLPSLQASERSFSTSLRKGFRGAVAAHLNAVADNVVYQLYKLESVCGCRCVWGFSDEMFLFLSEPVDQKPKSVPHLWPACSL